MPDDTTSGRSFDKLTRELADGRLSRRRAVQLFAATAAAALIPARAMAARPECRREGQPCRRSDECCGGLWCSTGARGNARRCIPVPPPPA